MTEEQIQTFVDLVEWAEMLDLHPVDEAQMIEREIDAKLESTVLTDRREAILAAFREQPLTKNEADELISELAEIKTKLQEVIDPTGFGWFDFEKVAEVQF